MKAENKEIFFKFLNKEISTECFENWMYQNKNLENDLKVAEEKIVSLTTLSNWYEKKFSKAPDNLPKNK